MKRKKNNIFDFNISPNENRIQKINDAESERGDSKKNDCSVSFFLFSIQKIG